MTNEELVEKIQQGERDLLPRLWEQVERFVSKVAVRWAKAVEPDNIPQAMEFADELIHTGYIAVVEAADTFDATQGAVFMTHLGFYIKKHFESECAAASGIPRGIYSRAGAARQKKKQGQKLSGLEQKMIKFCFPTSLNTPVGDGRRDDDREELGDLIPDPVDDFADAEERIFQQQLHEALEEALGQLPENQEKVIRLRFYQEFSQGEVCEQLGVSRERVRELQEKALWNLKQRRNLESYIDRRNAQYVQQFVEDRTPYYLRVSVDTFQNTRLSAVERIVLKREHLRKTAEGRISKMMEKEGANDT